MGNPNVCSIHEFHRLRDRAAGMIPAIAVWTLPIRIAELFPHHGVRRRTVSAGCCHVFYVNGRALCTTSVVLFWWESTNSDVSILESDLSTGHPGGPILGRVIVPETPIAFRAGDHEPKREQQMFAARQGGRWAH